jgi:hypothetical protein
MAPVLRYGVCITAAAENTAWTTASLGIATRCAERSHEQLRKFRASAEGV